MAKADGWITIAADLETKEFDKKYEKLKDKLEQAEIKKEHFAKTSSSAEVEYEFSKKDYDEILEKLREIRKEREEIEKTKLDITEPNATGGRRIPVENEKQYKELILQDSILENQATHLHEKLQEQSAELEKQRVEAEKQTYQYEKQANLVSQIEDDLSQMEANHLQKQMEEIEKTSERISENISNSIYKSMSAVGGKIKDVVKSVFRWGLAILSVRSAYMFVRQAMGTLAQYNEKLAADLQYIRFAIASALEPIIIRIVQWIYKLLSLIGTLIKSLTGFNIFKNSGADKFEKSLNKSKKTANEIKKTLAGFDEMNVLSDSSGGGTDEGGGAVSPSTDLSKLSDGKVPEWMKWIVKNGDLIKKIIIGIGLAIAALKIAQFLQMLGLFADLPLLQVAGGIALILGGIILLVKGIMDFIKDPSWQNFLTILEGIALIVAGIAILMGAWIVALIALGVAIVAYVIKHWDKVKEILGKIGSWIYDNIVEPVIKIFSGLWDSIKEIFSPVVDFFSAIFKTAFENIKIFIDNTKQIFKLLFDGIKTLLKPFIDNVVAGFKLVWSKIKEVFSPFVNFFANLFNQLKNKLKEFGAKVGEIIGGAIKSVINAIIGRIESVLNFPSWAINHLIDLVNNLPGVHLTKFKTYSLPRLAQGGIINYPNRGVPIGNAIGGESGKEGVIPLTDSQQMALLGEAIGKYITINADIPIIMNGRMLSREMRKVDNKTNFATNGRW